MYVSMWQKIEKKIIQVFFFSYNLEFFKLNQRPCTYISRAMLGVLCSWPRIAAICDKTPTDSMYAYIEEKNRSRLKYNRETIITLISEMYVCTFSKIEKEHAYKFLYLKTHDLWCTSETSTMQLSSGKL